MILLNTFWWTDVNIELIQLFLWRILPALKSWKQCLFSFECYPVISLIVRFIYYPPIISVFVLWQCQWFSPSSPSWYVAKSTRGPFFSHFRVSLLCVGIYLGPYSPLSAQPTSVWECHHLLAVSVLCFLFHYFPWYSVVAIEIPLLRFLFPACFPLPLFPPCCYSSVVL